MGVAAQLQLPQTSPWLAAGPGQQGPRGSTRPRASLRGRSVWTVPLGLRLRPGRPLPPPAPAATATAHKAPPTPTLWAPPPPPNLQQLIGRWPRRLPGNAVRGWERQGPKGGRGSSACGEEERGWGWGGARNASRLAESRREVRPQAIRVERQEDWFPPDRCQRGAPRPTRRPQTGARWGPGPDGSSPQTPPGQASGPRTPASCSPRGPGGLWVTGGGKAAQPAPRSRGLPAHHVPGPRLPAGHTSASRDGGVCPRPSSRTQEGEGGSGSRDSLLPYIHTAPPPQS
nr:uncharacterized protein LOC112586774 [Bubalus bubalis]